MKRKIIRVGTYFASVMLLTVSFYEFIYSQEKEAIVIGEKVTMQSNILEKELQLSIHIPDGDEVSEIRCPVLYIFQTHFEQVSGAVKNLYSITFHSLHFFAKNDQISNNKFQINLK